VRPAASAGRAGAAAGRPPLVAVLHGAVPAGAPPDELDTLVQAREVGEILRGLGHAVAPLPVGHDLSRLRRLRALQPSLVFYLVEALEGDGRLLHLPASVLDGIGLPYTGSPSRALYATTDKPLAKRLMAGAGLPTPATWDSEAGHGPGELFIVKSTHEDASLGLGPDSVVPAAAVPALLEERRRRLGGDWFAEAYVDGREFNVPLLEGPDGNPELLPIGEMLFERWPAGEPRIIGYAAKWDPASFAYNATPRTFAPGPGDGPLRARLAELASAAWRLFGLAGYARVDFRVDRAGRPLLLEVNANPCLSADAGYVAAAEEAGLTQADLVGRIAAAALRRTKPAVPPTTLAGAAS
jgi:D-alanine-D-alanine ligase